MAKHELGWGVAVMVAAIVVGAGCGDDEDSRGQGGNGASGGQGGDGAGGAAGGLAWEDCYTGLSCATVDVPVDYAAPDGARVGIRIIKADARGERRGSVLVNFGGPGAEGVSTVASLAGGLALVLPQMSDAYDIIGFDWRGVGQSNPVHCFEDAEYDAIRALPYHPMTPAEEMAYEVAIGAFKDACVANNDADFLASVHTENAARDMDEIRKALGDDQLNYIGISYGTWLGATYATLFPDTVGAMVLDSPLGIVANREDMLALSANEYEVSLSRFVSDCAADAACAFHGGTDVATVDAAVDALLASVDGGGVDGGGAPLSHSDAVGALWVMLRGGNPQWPALASALAAAEGGDGSAMLAAADANIGKGPDGYNNFAAALLSIGCLDLPFSSGFAFADLWSFFDGLDGTAPRMARASTALAACIDWPFAVEQPAISAPTAPPMLIIAGLHDPATPYVGAAEMHAALGNDSHLITYEGDGHGMLSLSACARTAADAFFADPTSAPSTSTCPAE